MLSRALKVLAAAFALSLASTPVMADDTESDGYDKLVQAFASDEIALLVFDSQMEIGVVAALKADPDSAAFEEECPGYFSGLVAAMRPPMVESHMRDYVWYRGRLRSIFEAEMFEDDAREAGVFWASELGQRFIKSILNLHSYDNIVSEALADEDAKISAEAFEADKRETAARVVDGLTDEDRQALEATFASARWAKSFVRIRPEMQAASLEMTNREYTPEEDAEIDALAEEFATAHAEACPIAE